MSRRLSADQEFLWRAVVTRTYPSGNQHTTICGPFTAKNHTTGSAKAEAGGGIHPVTITIQRTPLNWETVETREDPHDRRKT